MQESGEWEVGGGEMCSRDLAGHPEVWQWRCAGGVNELDRYDCSMLSLGCVALVDQHESKVCWNLLQILLCTFTLWKAGGERTFPFFRNHRRSTCQEVQWAIGPDYLSQSLSIR